MSQFFPFFVEVSVQQLLNRSKKLEGLAPVNICFQSYTEKKLDEG